MDSKWFSLMDLAIVAIPALGIGIWQLVSINREIARDKQKKADALAQGQPSPERAGHPVGEHGLDDR